MRYDDYEILDFIKDTYDATELHRIMGFSFDEFVDEIAELILENKEAFLPDMDAEFFDDEH
jgi:hypothetical protein